jgi:hypothetical protein
MTYVHFDINGKSLDLDELDQCGARVESAVLGAMVLALDKKLEELVWPGARQAADYPHARPVGG